MGILLQNCFLVIFISGWPFAFCSNQSTLVNNSELFIRNRLSVPNALCFMKTLLVVICTIMLSIPSPWMNGIASPSINRMCAQANDYFCSKVSTRCFLGSIVYPPFVAIFSSAHLTLLHNSHLLSSGPLSSLIRHNFATVKTAQKYSTFVALFKYHCSRSAYLRFLDRQVSNMVRTSSAPLFPIQAAFVFEFNIFTHGFIPTTFNCILNF